MAIGILTGSGTYALPGFAGSGPAPVETPFGVALVSSGTWAGVDVLHISRHEAGHRRLSNHVTHRANVAALKSLGAVGVLAGAGWGAGRPGARVGGPGWFRGLDLLSDPPARRSP